MEEGQPMNVNNDFHIDSLHARITDAEEALKEARQRWYDALPTIPAGTTDCPACGCDWTEYPALQRVEEGYQRWTNGQVYTRHHEPYVHWSTDSWDDMSEGGEFEYVQCNPFRAEGGGCGAAFQIPDDEEWD